MKKTELLKELRNSSADELVSRVSRLERQVLRLMLAPQVDAKKSTEARSLKQEIARAMTILREKQDGAVVKG